MHSQLVLGNAHGESPLLSLLSCHEAAIHILVEPGVVAGGQVRDNSGKLDGPLNPCPASQNQTSLGQPTRETERNRSQTVHRIGRDASVACSTWINRTERIG